MPPKLHLSIFCALSALGGSLRAAEALTRDVLAAAGKPNPTVRCIPSAHVQSEAFRGKGCRPHVP